jgi:hypothetical protein
MMSMERFETVLCELFFYKLALYGHGSHAFELCRHYGA